MERTRRTQLWGDIVMALVGGIVLMLAGMLTGFIIGVRFEGFVLDATEWFRVMTVGTFLAGFIGTFVFVRRRRAKRERESLLDALDREFQDAIDNPPLVKSVRIGGTKKDAPVPTGRPALKLCQEPLLPADIAAADATEHLNNPPDAATSYWRKMFGRRGNPLSRRGRNGLE